jgi:hypothetical protein
MSSRTPPEWPSENEAADGFGRGMPFDHLADCAAQMWPRVHPPCARRDLLGETRAGVAVSLGSGSRTDLVGLRIRHPVQPSRSTGAGVLIQTGDNTDSATEFQ